MTYENIGTKGMPIKGVDERRTGRRQGARAAHEHGAIAVRALAHRDHAGRTIRGTGATVGSVIPTVGAIIPAAVGVDIGCGMAAVRTNITAERLPDSLASLRSEIEAAVPHGRTDYGGRNDIGAWQSEIPAHANGSLARFAGTLWRTR